MVCYRYMKLSRNQMQSNPVMILRCLALITGVLVFSPLMADSWNISIEEWSRPRSGESLVQMQGLVKAVTALNADPFSKLQLRYPGGEEGALWTSELRDWLVSLGIPSSRIELYPGQSSNENITLILKTEKESKE